MVIPSFGTFAPTPRLAESFLGGVRLRLEQERISQAAAQANAQLAIQQQRLQQEAQQHQMELEVKKEQLQQQTERQRQELEMTKAYREAFMGMRQREIENRKQALDQNLKMAMAREQDTARHQMATEEETARHHGVMEDVAQSRMGGGEPFVPTSMDVDGQKMFQTSPRRWQLAPSSRDTSPAIAAARINAVRQQVTSLENNISKNAQNAKLDPKGYAADRARLEAKRSELDSLLQSAGGGPTLPPSLQGGSKTNKVGRFNVIEDVANPQESDEDEEQ